MPRCSGLTKTMNGSITDNEAKTNISLIVIHYYPRNSYMLITNNSAIVWVFSLQWNQCWPGLESRKKKSLAQESLKDYNQFLEDYLNVDQSCKNLVNPFSWCLCWNGGMIFFVVLWGCFWLMCLKVLLSECSFLPCCFLAPLLCLTCNTYMVPLAPWILSLLPWCPCSLLHFLSGSLRFRPGHSVSAHGQGSACTRTTTDPEGWGGWVCPCDCRPRSVCLCVCP